MKYLIMIPLLLLFSCRSVLIVQVGRSHQSDAVQAADKELGDIARGASASAPVSATR